MSQLAIGNLLPRTARYPPSSYPDNDYNGRDAEGTSSLHEVTKMGVDTSQISDQNLTKKFSTFLCVCVMDGGASPT